MPINAISILTLLGLTISLGYIGKLVFSRTKIPDIFWLLCFGLLVGPIFGLIDIGIFLEVSPLLSSAALIIILFDAGLYLDFYQTIRQIPKSLFLMILGVLFGIISVAILSIFMFNFSWLQAILLGTIVSGTSAEMIIVLLKQLKVRENISTLLNLETVSQDPLTIVLVIFMIQMLVSTSPTQSFASLLAGSYSIALVIGLMTGLIWIFVLDKIKGAQFDYMITLSALLLLYVFTETIGGSGPLAALIFGLVLGNSKTFSRMLRFKKVFEMDHFLERFQTEITFFVSSFFFVFIGLTVSINQTFILYGLIIAAVLIISRIFAVKIAFRKLDVSPLEYNVAKAMVPRGLTTAVLAQLPLAAGIPGGDVFLGISFVVILSTVLYTSFSLRHLMKSNIQTKVEKKKDTKRVSEKRDNSKSSKVVLFQPQQYSS